MTKLLQDWSAAFPGVGPVAHLLKSAFPDPWVRFHSLPLSKRYPDTAAEYDIVLERHHAIIGSLAAPGTPVVLLTTEYSTSDVPGLYVWGSPPAESADASWWRTVPPDDDAEGYMHVYAEQVVWHPGRFDPLVRRVADDEVANVMICDPDCRWVVHPYDGGMDVVLSSAADRDRLRSRYAAWLSARPDGR